MQVLFISMEIILNLLIHLTCRAIRGWSYYFILNLPEDKNSQVLSSMGSEMLTAIISLYCLLHLSQPR